MISALVVIMTRDEIKQHNQIVIALVIALLDKRQASRLQYGLYRLRPPKLGYKELAAKLNADKITTSRGNRWTMRALYRMMQRQGLRLHDLCNLAIKKSLNT